MTKRVREAMKNRIDLEGAGAQQFGQVMAAATELGGCEAGSAVDRTGKELARLFCTVWRMGHERALRAAYPAGRFHGEVK